MERSRPIDATEPTFDLVAVGDVCLGDHPMMVGCGLGSRLRGGVSGDYPFSYVKPLLAGADVAFCNLETPLSNVGVGASEYNTLQMRGLPASAERLARAGFTVANIANNHVLQHGTRGFHDTVSALGNCGITAVGVAEPDTDATVRRVMTVKGIRVAFLAYAFEPDVYFEGRPLYAVGPQCDLKREIMDARRWADVVVCSLHWGREFIRVPSAPMVAFARELVDAGASVVLGHHPHVFQAIEQYRNGVIAYSLGNFASDMPWDEPLTRGLVLRCRVSRRGVVRVEPRFAVATRDFQPRPATPAEHRAELETLDALRARLRTPPSQFEYSREALELINRNRYLSYRHLCRHLSDYPIRLASAILWQAARRKYVELTSRRGSSIAAPVASPPAA